MSQQLQESLQACRQAVQDLADCITAIKLANSLDEHELTEQVAKFVELYYPDPNMITELDQMLEALGEGDDGQEDEG